MSLFGVVANPASGKDVRRLVARASVFDNQEKQAIVERALIGAEAAGASEFAYLDDPNGIVANAVRENGRLCAKPLDTTRTRTALDTITAARALKDLGCAVVITLGGDGTNRAFALGWPDAPLIPLSTGTNNVFPRLAEATLAGAAAGLIASGQLALGEVAAQQKAVQVTVEGRAPRPCADRRGAEPGALRRRSCPARAGTARHRPAHPRRGGSGGHHRHRRAAASLVARCRRRAAAPLRPRRRAAAGAHRARTVQDG